MSESKCQQKRCLFLDKDTRYFEIVVAIISCVIGVSLIVFNWSLPLMPAVGIIFISIATWNFSLATRPLRKRLQRERYLAMVVNSAIWLILAMTSYQSFNIFGSAMSSGLFISTSFNSILLRLEI